MPYLWMLALMAAVFALAGAGLEFENWLRRREARRYPDVAHVHGLAAGLASPWFDPAPMDDDEAAAWNRGQQ